MNKNINSLFFVLILFVVEFLSCQNRNSLHEEVKKDSAESLSKTSVSHSVNTDSVIKIIPHTTLDSLQGIWISGKDKNDIVTIKGNQYIETYKGEKDTLISKIIFTDTCIDDNPTYDYVSKLDDTKQNGKHFISLDTKDTSSNCVNIDELDNNYLELSYHGHLLPFDKKKK